MRLAVEIWIILVPGEGANAERALHGVDDNAVDADRVEHLIHIRLAVDAVVRIPERRVVDGQPLIKRRRLDGESGSACRRERLPILLRGYAVTRCSDDTSGKRYRLARR